MALADRDVLDRYHRRFAALDAIVPEPAPMHLVAGAVPRARPRYGQHLGRGFMPAFVLLMVIIALATLSVLGAPWRSPGSSPNTPGNGGDNATGLMVTLGPTVTVPAGWVRPVDECLHDAGFIATAVHPAVSGYNAKYGYSWESPTYFSWTMPGTATQGGHSGCSRTAAARRHGPAQDRSGDQSHLRPLGP
jgi:hypothetical protein